ncbi:MAG: ATPase, T2SS/T4P/T4SS family [Fimbriimonadales bacterium]
MRVRLGELLVQYGKITPDQLVKALQTQKETGKKLGETLIELGFITREEYYAAQALQYQVPYEPLHEPSLQQAANLKQYIPLQIASRYFVIPFKLESQVLWVATPEPDSLEMLDTIRQATRLRVKPCYTPAERVLRAITRIYGDVEESVEAIEVGVEEEWEPEDAERAQDLGNQHPIIRLVNEIIRDAVSQNASDIHLEPSERHLQVRYRVDGVLRHSRNIPKSMQAAVSARVKLMAEMNIAERRKPQDGRFTVQVNERKIDMRVSVLPTVFGERIVLRLLDRSASLKTLDQLGMPDPISQHLLDLAARPWGMILVTGPTGSGKSTTLYALLQKIRSDRRNILTCEDPVEYTIEGIGQSQVNEKVGVTFASQLRAILRQDPDVVLVGEIRDRETAEIACRAAMTGHLVLSTLHTNDATSAPARLIDMGIEPYLINSSLVGVLAQRLVRKLCSRCKQESVYSGTDWLPQGTVVYEPVGCDACSQTGYKGRIGMYELFVLTDTIRRQISQSADNDLLRTLAPPGTLFTMETHARQLLESGITSLEEVLAHLNLQQTHRSAA